jgi:GTPase SAR1 family protein
MSGDDDFKFIRKQFYPDAMGVVMVFDVNIKTTFDNLSKWEKEVEANGLDLTKAVVIVLGNKIDKKKKRVKLFYSKC